MEKTLKLKFPTFKSETIRAIHYLKNCHHKVIKRISML
jgi:hypothetical protein